jgi:hypothetical protein
MSQRLSRDEIGKYIIFRDGKFLLNLPLFNNLPLVNYANENIYPDTNSRIRIDPLLAQRIVPSFQTWNFQNGLATTVETTQFIYANGSSSFDVILPYAKVHSLISYIKRKNRESNRALGLQKKPSKKAPKIEDRPIRSRNELLDL